MFFRPRRTPQMPRLTGTPPISNPNMARIWGGLGTPRRVRLISPTHHLPHGCPTKKPHRPSLSETLAHSLSSLAPFSPLPTPILIESGAMSSSGSRSDDKVDPEYELALRIALERSKVETGAAPDLQPRRSRSFTVGASR